MSVGEPKKKVPRRYRKGPKYAFSRGSAESLLGRRQTFKDLAGPAVEIDSFLREMITDRVAWRLTRAQIARELGISVATAQFGGPVSKEVNSKMVAPTGALEAAKAITPEVMVDVRSHGLEAAEVVAAFDMLLVNRAREFGKAHSASVSVDRVTNITEARDNLIRAVHAFESLKDQITEAVKEQFTNTDEADE